MERQQAVMLLGLKHDRGIMRRELRLEETRGKCNQVTTLKNPTLLTPGNPSG